MGELDYIEPKIQDIDDLEDRILVLDSVVADLRSQSLSAIQLRMVKNM